MLYSSLLEILSCRFPRSRDCSLEARGQGAMGDKPSVACFQFRVLSRDILYVYVRRYAAVDTWIYVCRYAAVDT